MKSLPRTTTTTQPHIAVYFSNGENANTPWHVGLKVGRAVDDHYGSFRNPLDAITHALDNVAEALDLPVVWPEWLRVVLPAVSHG